MMMVASPSSSSMLTKPFAVVGRSLKLSFECRPQLD